MKKVTLCNQEFIRRFMMHVLPSGFQKIRYYGFFEQPQQTENATPYF